ncbi:Protein unc-13 C [Blastocladiella emersonii ATCC 22665]|nr:Protein unc-13 C [Blastocladiella emersonii ATCC 22665]
MLATGQTTAPAAPGAYVTYEDGYRLEGLTVTVVESRKVADSDAMPFNSADPYVVVTVGSVKKTTKIHKGEGNSVTFNEKFEIDVPAGATHLVVQMFDKDTFTSDDLLGEVKIDLKDVARANVDKFFPLAAGGKSAGELRLAVHPRGSITGKIHDALHGHGASNPISKLKEKLHRKKKHDGDSSSSSDSDSD